MVRKLDWNHDGWDDLILGYANDLFYILLNELRAEWNAAVFGSETDRCAGGVMAIHISPLPIGIATATTI